MINEIKDQNLEQLNKRSNERRLFGIGYIGFLKITSVIDLMPYSLRWVYWTLLYYYNIYRFPAGQLTLKLYRSYTKRKRIIKNK